MVAPITGIRIGTIGHITRKGRLFGGQHDLAPPGRLGHSINRMGAARR
jgi:hypothetical protein